MATNKGIYSDLDFMFYRNPITDDVAKKLDDNAIKQSLKNLVLLRKFDSPFHPEICSQIVDSLFENITPMSLAIIKRAITYTIENFEPRVRLLSVDIADMINSNTLQITIVYEIIATGITSSYSFTINRTR